MKSKKLEIIWTVVSIVIGVVYTVVSEIFTDLPFISSFTYGLILSILTEIISMLILVASSVHEVQEVAKKISADEVSAGERLLKLGANIERSKNILVNIQTARDEILRHSAQLLQRRTILGEIGIRTIRGYLADFRVSEYGFSVRGEYWSLRTYIEVWQTLVEEQGKVSREPSKMIIARVTHSNDIRIWKTAELPEAQTLLALQRQFVKLGGVIIRILLGPALEPDDDYKQVMEIMKKAGVEVRYVCRDRVPDFAFDFLYLHDQGIVAKWFAGAGGRILSHIDISDEVENPIVERWVALAEISEETEGPIKQIPEERQIGSRRNLHIDLAQMPTSGSNRMPVSQG